MYNKWLLVLLIIFNINRNSFGQSSNNATEENIETTTKPPLNFGPTIFDVFLKGNSISSATVTTTTTTTRPPSIQSTFEQFAGNPHVGIIRLNNVPSPGPEFVHQGVNPQIINSNYPQQQTPSPPPPPPPPPPPLPPAPAPAHASTSQQQQRPAAGGYLPNGYGGVPFNYPPYQQQQPFPTNQQTYPSNQPPPRPQTSFTNQGQQYPFPNYYPYQRPQDINQNPGGGYVNQVYNNQPTYPNPPNNNFYQSDPKTRRPVGPYDRQVASGDTTNNQQQKDGEPDLSTENIYTGAQFPGQAFPVPFGPQQGFPAGGFGPPGNFGPTNQFPNFNPNFTGTQFGSGSTNNNNNNNSNNNSNNNGFPTSGFPPLPGFNSQGPPNGVGFYGPLNGFGGSFPNGFTPPFGTTSLTSFNSQPT